MKFGCWDAVSAIASIVLAAITIFAIFWPQIRDFYKRPKLTTSFPSPGMKTSWTAAGRPISNCYYFGLEVINNGENTARMIEVNAIALRQKDSDGNFIDRKTFPRMNLTWSWRKNTYLEYLPKKVPKPFDILHIDDPSKSPSANPRIIGNEANGTRLIFDVIPHPANECHVISEPGIYRLTLLVAADNCSPLEVTLEIQFDGRWYEDENMMFERGCKIQMI